MDIVTDLNVSTHTYSLLTPHIHYVNFNHVKTVKKPKDFVIKSKKK